jgi:hypothetical protein
MCPAALPLQKNIAAMPPNKCLSGNAAAQVCSGSAAHIFYGGVVA